ncbi:hypothetical protein I203_104699 [Kwoniella mangroviensis CBS 8507]|uniref:uncharacterized protein n=1 Tax=Kwoniella mangroviensis CBS 8507 TaxID=1296122 RepID=UPI00080D45EE|nr:uncharacterized protein I203_00356 [Kwoniella mangroviensis CBS 8507]OCF70224.1 hypothetical protein I203_00356 [Kwoniella mangroviensis CBS 8507]
MFDALTKVITDAFSGWSENTTNSTDTPVDVDAYTDDMATRSTKYKYTLHPQMNWHTGGRYFEYSCKIRSNSSVNARAGVGGEEEEMIRQALQRQVDKTVFTLNSNADYTSYPSNAGAVISSTQLFAYSAKKFEENTVNKGLVDVETFQTELGDDLKD